MKFQIIGDDGPAVKPQGFDDARLISVSYRDMNGRQVGDVAWIVEIESLDELARMIVYYGTVRMRQMSNGYVSIYNGRF